MTINRTIAFGIILLAAFFVAALSFALVSLRETPMNPSPGGGPNPAPILSPTPAPNRIIAGVVMSVALSDEKIVIGAYRVENNKAVLASQSTVYYTSATVFSREAKSQNGLAAENKISPRDIKIGEAAMIVVSGKSSANRLVAERVMFLLPPLPPRK